MRTTSSAGMRVPPNLQECSFCFSLQNQRRIRVPGSNNWNAEDPIGADMERKVFRKVDKPHGFNSSVDILTVPTSQAKCRILRDGARMNELRDDAFRRIILSIPAGKVSTYGRVATAAGYPLYHRAVARLLRTDPSDHLPWHRVLGAGGEIKLRNEAAKEQKARLRMEGVKFHAKRIDMERFEYQIHTWETFE
jgi:methylated-DNA-protein-cysteine methyltransferase-like protein